MLLYSTDWWRPTRHEFNYAFARYRAGARDRLQALLDWQCHMEAQNILLGRVGIPTRVTHVIWERMFAALAAKDAATLALLMDTGLGPRAQTLRSRQTALHVAALFAWRQGIDLLLQAGAESSAVDHLGNTPLHCAVRAGSFDCVKALVRAGTDVNAMNRDDQTVLHLIAKAPLAWDTLDIVGFLAGSQINATIQDKRGHTAMDLALSMQRHQSIVPLFRSYGF